MKHRKSDGNFLFRIVMGLCIILSLLSEITINAYAEEYEYDDLNRVVKVIYDDGRFVEYKYDKNGNLLETTVSWEDKGSENVTGGSGNGTNTEDNDAEASSSGEETSGGSTDTSQEDGANKDFPEKNDRGENGNSVPQEGESVKDSDRILENGEVIGEDDDRTGEQTESETSETDSADVTASKKKLHILFAKLFDFLASPYGKILMWILKLLLIEV